VTEEEEIVPELTIPVFREEETPEETVPVAMEDIELVVLEEDCIGMPLVAVT